MPTLPNTQCPNEQGLKAFCRGALPESQLETIARHIENCATCELTLANFAPEPDLLQDAIRRSAQWKQLADDPVLRRLEEQRAGPALIPSQLPFRLGKYDLLEVLGRGGMGVVYRARHISLQRIVAVKVLSPRLAAAPEVVRRFQHEIRLMGGWGPRQPHLVAAIDAEIDEGRAFLVMEYVRGSDLAKLVREVGPLSIAAVGEVGYQVLQALQSLHELRLVHRDLKPSNLMLEAGVIRLLDFGLARIDDDRDASEDLTASGQFLGTADYVAPEQIQDPRQTDARGDIYSLGCTLFFLLAGRAPFGDLATREDKCRAHQAAPPPDIRQLRPEVPADLADLIARMLEKNPQSRLRGPTEVAKKLKKYVGRGQLSDLSRLASECPAPRGGTESTVDLAGSTHRPRRRLRKLIDRIGAKGGMGVILFGLTGLLFAAAATSRQRSPLPQSLSPAITRPSSPPPQPRVAERRTVVPKIAVPSRAGSNSFFKVDEATNKLHLVADDYFMVNLGTLAEEDASVEITIEPGELKSPMGHVGVFFGLRDSADREQTQYQSLRLTNVAGGTVIAERSLTTFLSRAPGSRDSRDLSSVSLTRLLRLNTVSVKVTAGRLRQVTWNNNPVETIEPAADDDRGDYNLTGVYGVFAYKAVAVFSSFKSQGSDLEFKP